LCFQKYGVGEHCVGAISYGAGAMWPYRFVTALYSKMLTRFGETFTIETGTIVERIETVQDPSYPQYLLKTSRGYVQADTVIHATDAFAANHIPGLKGKLFPVRGHMTAQRPGSAFPNFDGKRSWSFVHKSGFDYVTQRPGEKDAAPGGLGAEIMLGGGLVQSPAQGLDEFGIWADNKTSFPIASYLSGILSVAFSPETWGDDSGMTRVKALWSGSMGFTADMLPLVGKLEGSLTRRKPRNGSGLAGEYIVAGFNAEGMVSAWLSGVAVGLMVLGRDDVVSGGADGRPEGQVKDWFPDQYRCSQARVTRSSLSELATLL
jgi:glycine/D-amino acid oxidase-like deaminating enzyme